MNKNLYFRDSNDNKYLVAANIDENFIGKFIATDLKTRRPNYEIYYFRSWRDDENPAITWYDYGSWSEFYTVEEEENEAN